jgi:hypothetical protein
VLDESLREQLPPDLAADIEGLRQRIALLPAAQRQACALLVAARLVEESAYFNASEGTLPVTTRLMMWAHELERMSDAFVRAS